MSRITDIISKCRVTLADKDGDRYTDDDLIALIDEAQEDFCKETKILKASANVSLFVGAQTLIMPEDCFMLTRATYQNEKIPLLTYSDVDFFLSNGDSQNLLGMTYSWEEEIGTPEALIYDKNNLGEVRVYPIPANLVEEDTVTVDPLGVVSDLDLFGVLTTSDTFGTVTDIETTGDVVKIYYVKFPTKVTTVNSTLDLDRVFDTALKYYVTGKSFLNDLDTGWQEKGLQQLQFYEREVKRAKNNAASNHVSSGEFSTNYRSSF